MAYTPRNARSETTSTGRQKSSPAIQNIPIKTETGAKIREAFLHGPKPAKYESFPLVSVLSKPDMSRSIEIMQDLAQYEEQLDTLKNAVDALKLELQEISERNELPGGMRWGRYVVYVTPRAGDRRMKAALVQEMLLRHGVPLKEFEDCYEIGKPRIEVKFTDLEKPRKPRRDSPDEEE